MRLPLGSLGGNHGANNTSVNFRPAWVLPVSANADKHTIVRPACLQEGNSGRSAFLSVRSTKLDLLWRMPLIL